MKLLPAAYYRILLFFESENGRSECAKRKRQQKNSKDANEKTPKPSNMFSVAATENAKGMI